MGARQDQACRWNLHHVHIEHGKALPMDHNKRFSKGNKPLPAVNEEAMYGSLASSHCNLALRCIQTGLHSPIGTLSDLIALNSNLKDVVLKWVLQEVVSMERQVDISLWRNMDQNENQVRHDIEILQSIKAIAEQLSQKQANVAQGDLVACVFLGGTLPRSVLMP